MTIEQVRKDLADIRYYYSMETVFKKSSSLIVPKLFMEKVEKYSKAMSMSNPRLFTVYVALYVQNNSQQTVADDWCRSREYVRQLNKDLCEFLVKTLTDIENSEQGGQ